MNCPHCDKPIDLKLAASALAKLNAGKPRPGARGLVRNPAGRPKKSPAA